MIDTPITCWSTSTLDSRVVGLRWRWRLAGWMYARQVGRGLLPISNAGVYSLGSRVTLRVFSWMMYLGGTQAPCPCESAPLLRFRVCCVCYPVILSFLHAFTVLRPCSCRIALEHRNEVPAEPGAGESGRGLRYVETRLQELDSHLGIPLALLDYGMADLHHSVGLTKSE
ncbi:hypothetical protein L227DRAFT_292108 [Lentinus tigrinus ALCF2SS1-6]|uniref:Uncharacterized protein n=1 Tax=Lentinus tigrinus ALCF2SS1-6 TaxID=1328759 RepID=A0A5C2RY85_9APHY|nr:hypothetical protein L227DRAFT_292108 [Lentinus tigrinus ALCF2SS1-6]